MRTWEDVELNYIDNKRSEWLKVPRENPELLGMSFEKWLCHELFRVEEMAEYLKNEGHGVVESLDLMLEQERRRTTDAIKERDMWHEAFRELSKSHIEQANKLRDLK